jgi:hypothetical protein
VRTACPACLAGSPLLCAQRETKLAKLKDESAALKARREGVLRRAPPRAGPLDTLAACARSRNEQEAFAPGGPRAV